MEVNDNILRAFTPRVLKILAFSNSKSHFITFNISLYNTPNIKVSFFFFFLQLHLNILFLFFFILFFFHPLPLCLTVSLSLFVSLSFSTQQSYPPATTIPTTTTLINSMTHAELLADDPRQSPLNIDAHAG